MTGQEFQGGGAPANKLLKGFTMAEVLITLGIIGIIAAMTFPALYGKYQMKTFEVAFKKQYSTIQNAINAITAEYGINACYIYFPKGNIAYQKRDEDCALLEEHLISMLNLNEYDDAIKDKYAKRAQILAEGGSSINWACSYDYAVDRADVYISNDGTVFMFGLGDDQALLSVVIDVNGEKGPNRWGYDVFFMLLSNHNQYESGSNMIFLTDEFCTIAEKGGKFPRTILRNQKQNTDTSYYW